MDKKIKVAIIGATGYAGAEIVRILLNHPFAEIVALSSVSYCGQRFSDIYPNFKKLCDLELVATDDVFDKFDADVIFASLPHGLSEGIAKKCLDSGKVLIDLGADFRLESEDEYSEWYGKKYDIKEIHSDALYCLPEYNRDKIASAKIIANPGCYPTSVALGLMPALKNKLISPNGIIIDSKSGVTGAGRGLTQNTHFPDTNEAFSAYKAGQHRHTPEIEQTLSHLYGEKMCVTFVPHLLPVNRGIESTIYASVADGTSFDDIVNAYKKAYENEYFVRLEAPGSYANIKNVRCTNFCDISLHFDKRAGKLIVCSVIDNMFKGAAGQAIQNMNIKFGIEETTGLKFVAPAF